MVFAASKMSWLRETSVIRLLIVLGSSFEIFDGWFECLLTLTVSLCGFQNSWHVLFIKSQHTSRKSTLFKFVLTLMLSPQPLKI